MLTETKNRNKWNLVVLLFIICVTCFGVVWQQKTGDFNYVIRSDGSGYYAYLPSAFLYDDPTFEKAKEAEAAYHNGDVSNVYLFKTDNGAYYNKYFPGLAILQLPFFLLACLFAKLSGQPVDGYSSVFQVFFFIGNLVYAVAGVYLCLRFLKSFLRQYTGAIQPVLLLFYVSTPLLFYSFFTPSFTHVYSLFVIAVLANVLIRLRDEITTFRLLLVGLLLGLIFLLRPTNLVVVLAVPLFWSSSKEMIEWFNELFRKHLSKLVWLIVSFSGTVFILFLSWKWQTGKWIVWSYSGEGFDFLHPPLWSTLFSFRSGLLLHTPVMILVLFGWIYWFKTNRFQAIWWGIYALVNCWVIFSWWCWDYESPFGNRPFTEHMVLLILPLFFLHTKARKVTVGAMIFFALIGLIRLYTKTTGYMLDQRFTKDNYLESLCFWKKENQGRWYFTQSCEPHGKVRLSQEMLALNKRMEVHPSDEFLLTASYQFPKKRNGERYYVRVTLDKKVLSQLPFENVFLVVDAAKDGLNHRFYKAIDLYNDKLEAGNSWKSLVFETQVYDYLEEYDHFTVYIWNMGKAHFQLRNVRYEMMVYH